MKIYTPDEVAEVLKIHVVTVYRYIRSGKLRSSKIGQQYRISEEQLQDFFNENEVNKKK